MAIMDNNIYVIKVGSETVYKKIVLYFLKLKIY